MFSFTQWLVNSQETIIVLALQIFLFYLGIIYISYGIVYGLRRRFAKQKTQEYWFFVIFGFVFSAIGIFLPQAIEFVAKTLFKEMAID